MKKKMKKLVAGILVAALVIAGAAPASEVETVFAGTTEEQIKTPIEAVSEMTWGVNLADQYMDICNTTQDCTVGYSKFPPVGFAIWFWNENFEMLAEYEPHRTTIPVSVPLPDYDKKDSWVDGLFTMSVMLTDPKPTVKLKMSGSRLVLADGSTIALDFMDKTYCADSFAEPDENGWATCPLDFDKSKLPKKSPKLNGAFFETTVKLLNVSLPKGKTKADYYFQYYAKVKMDQYKLTDQFLDEGANVVRLPVTWTPFTDDKTFEIEKEWLDAVKREVDYIIGRGAYCILDLHNDYLMTSYVGDHWDERWMYDKYKPYVDERFATMWGQIAEYFKDYSQKLIFEPFNEPTMQWREDSPDDFEEVQARRVNELNALFVETVRATGGNNRTRFLYLPAGNYCDETWLSKLVLPEDDYLMVAVHSYDEMEGYEGEKLDYKAEIDDMFGVIRDFTEKTGVPVIVGETGVMYMHSEKELLDPVSYYFKKGRECGVPSLWWEDYFVGDDAHWLYDKEHGKWGRPRLLQAIKQAAGSADNLRDEGSLISDGGTEAVYKITSVKKKTLEYKKSTRKGIKTAVIPDTVKIDGISYKVTSIAANAFAGNTSLKKVTIGKNVTSIGSKAFYKCKNLRTIVVKTDKLTLKTVGKNAFSEGNTKPKVQTNKSVRKSYSKIFVKRGMSAKAKFV